MWDASAFDNGPSGGGGGFMDVTNQTSSPSAKKDQVRRLQSVVPVVIRQLNSCQEDEFRLFGFPAQMVAIVGILRNFDVQSTKATCNLEDHTGTIKAILWLENDNESSTTDLSLSVKDGSYVKVYGSIRGNDNEKIIMILKWFPIDDCNVITQHLLQVIHTRLEAQEMNRKSMIYTSHQPGQALATSMSMMAEDTNHGASINNLASGLTPLQEKIFNILKPVKSASGLHMNAILGHFPANQSREVHQALEFLVDEGHAYSTIDNDHFKATDSL